MFFHKIEIAINGEEVISKIKEKKFDAIIMDIEMPKMNGIEAIKEIRNLEKEKINHIPIIAITAHSLIYNEKDILKFGFDAFFIKPFKIKDIYHKTIEIINSQTKT